MNQLISAYFSLFLGAFVSTAIGLYFMNLLSWPALLAMGSMAGSAAVLSALIMTKAYLRALHARKLHKLKLQALIGVLLATLLFGLIAACYFLFGYLQAGKISLFLLKEFFFTASVFSVCAGILGFVPNYLFTLGFNAVVSRNYQAKTQGLKLHLN